MSTCTFSDSQQACDKEVFEDLLCLDHYARAFPETHPCCRANCGNHIIGTQLFCENHPTRKAIRVVDGTDVDQDDTQDVIEIQRFGHFMFKTTSHILTIKFHGVQVSSRLLKSVTNDYFTIALYTDRVHLQWHNSAIRCFEMTHIMKACFLWNTLNQMEHKITFDEEYMELRHSTLWIIKYADEEEVSNNQ